MRIAIDTGGTFTDCVFVRNGELQVLKLFSTPADPGQAIRNALSEIGPASVELRHGTTGATNTLLERSGARVAFVTTAGFEDTIAIGRQARSHLYDWSATPPEPLAAPAMRFGVQERTLPDGRILQIPQEADPPPPPPIPGATRCTSRRRRRRLRWRRQRRRGRADRGVG
jgi:N-methylhydantoinase A